MKSYKHIFFDLDHTLWDHDTNAHATLMLLYKEFGLEGKLAASAEDFHQQYVLVNSQKWSLYGKGKITKEELRATRFYDTFKFFGFDDSTFSKGFEETFIDICPRQTALLPGALEALNYLAENNYQMHIITNGFADVQDIKLSCSGIKDYFDVIVTSDKIGVNKPHARVFETSVKRALASHSESIMIGDNLQADVLGAQRFGMDQVYFNPGKNQHPEKPTYEIAALKELRTIF